MCDEYLMSWMRNFTSTEDRPTPLPADPTWQKKNYAATGDPDLKIQAKLAMSMGLSYCSGVGKLIWAMTTCWPNLAFASVKLSQANACLHNHHFYGVKYCLKYLYSTCNNGIYFWRTAPRIEFKIGQIPRINSNKQDLLFVIGHGIGGKVSQLKWCDSLKASRWSKRRRSVITRSHSHSMSDGSEIQVH